MKKVRFFVGGIAKQNIPLNSKRLKMIIGSHSNAKDLLKSKKSIISEVGEIYPDFDFSKADIKIEDGFGHFSIVNEYNLTIEPIKRRL